MVWSPFMCQTVPLTEARVKGLGGLQFGRSSPIAAMWWPWFS